MPFKMAKNTQYPCSYNPWWNRSIQCLFISVEFDISNPAAQVDGCCSLCRAMAVLTNERGVGGGGGVSWARLCCWKQGRGGWWLINAPCCAVLRVQNCVLDTGCSKTKEKTRMIAQIIAPTPGEVRAAHFKPHA